MGVNSRTEPEGSAPHTEGCCTHPVSTLLQCLFHGCSMQSGLARVLSVVLLIGRSSYSLPSGGIEGKGSQRIEKSRVFIFTFKTMCDFSRVKGI